MIRGALSAIARNEALGGLLSRAPLARDVVQRVVGGDEIADALSVARELADRGYWISIERASPSVHTAADAERVNDEYLALVDAIGAAGLTGVCEVTVFPESLGLAAEDAERTQKRLHGLSAYAVERGVGVMVGMGATEESGLTIRWVEDLNADGIDVGITLPALLYRTEGDCARLADRRVRLVKGGRPGAGQPAHVQPLETDKAFVRCAKTLLRGAGEPSFATHDPRLIGVLEALTVRAQRPRHTYEYAFYMGRQEGAQERLLAAGERVRIYVPYGPEWFERLVGGLAEQPSTIAAALRSLLPGSP